MNTGVTGQTDELPDLPGINIQAGLEITRDNVQLYRRLLLKFLDSQQSYLDKLSDARDQQDLSTMSEVAHSLKGVSGNLGINSVYEAVIALEAVCKTKAESIDALLDTVIEKLQIVCHGIEALRDQ